jgi:hypothetical protein
MVPQRPVPGAVRALDATIGEAEDAIAQAVPGPAESVS